MFKESAIEKLIEYIHALPEDEQQVIAENIRVKRKTSTNVRGKTTRKKLEEFVNFIDTLPTRLPKGYKFNREEANER